MQLSNILHYFMIDDMVSLMPTSLCRSHKSNFQPIKIVNTFTYSIYMYSKQATNKKKKEYIPFCKSEKKLN